MQRIWINSRVLLGFYPAIWKGYVEGYLKVKLGVLDLLSLHADILAGKKSSDELEEIKSLTLFQQSTALQFHDFNSIAQALNNLWKGTIVRVDELNKQFEVFKKLKKIANTGNDFYTLYEISLKDPALSNNSRKYVQDAAALGHFVAMRIVAGSALSGLFHKPKDDSIHWALNCIRFLEDYAIPKLEISNDTADIRTLRELNEGIIRARSRIDFNGEYTHGKAIPKEDSKEFAELVASINDRVEKNGSDAEFILNSGMFSILEEEIAPDIPTLKILQRNLQSKSKNIKKNVQEQEIRDKILKAIQRLQAHSQVHYKDKSPAGIKVFCERARNLCNDTPIGTGDNAEKEFTKFVCESISQLANRSFIQKGRATS